MLKIQVVALAAFAAAGCQSLGARDVAVAGANSVATVATGACRVAGESSVDVYAASLESAETEADVNAATAQWERRDRAIAKICDGFVVGWRTLRGSALTARAELVLESLDALAAETGLQFGGGLDD